MPTIKPNTKSLKKYVIFPCCLLVFGAMEEVVYYKTELVKNDYLRVGLLMFLFAFGVSVLAFVVTPFLERVVLQMHAASKKEAGRWGEFLFVGVLLAIVYFIWYRIFVYGPESVLPAAWRNPFF